jgi:sugar phosphate isomerase/epimerase
MLRPAPAQSAVHRTGLRAAADSTPRNSSIENGVLVKHVSLRGDAQLASASLPAQSPSGGVPAATRLSLSEMTTYRWSFAEDVLAYQRAGIGAVGVWRPKLSQFGDERGVELIVDCGMSVSSLSWAGGFTGSHGHSFQESVDDARDAIEVAAALGSGCLVLVSGARAGHTLNHARRLLLDALQLLVEPAAALGVQLALQPVHPRLAGECSFLTSLDDTLEVIDRCGSDAVSLAFNVYHLWHEPRLIERIPAVAPLVSIVQLSDWRAGSQSEHDRCLPGDGEVPLDDVVAAFSAADYRGYFELEIWSEELWNSNYEQVVQECQSRFAAHCCRQNGDRDTVTF